MPIYPVYECLLNINKVNQSILTVRGIFMFSLFEFLINQEEKDERPISSSKVKRGSQSSIVKWVLFQTLYLSLSFELSMRFPIEDNYKR
jgi:hypothetical protein